ncbi:MAG: permease-like cell division protein FtsX [Eubacteriales bacterium]|nr:permease-like cell division protein FtsX [Lachnospiraceae bacterium]MDO5128139.1 permease-like cell division protein FtsX [Eubacteriales bacterium]
MRISSFFYSIRQGIKNIRRNMLFSLASIGTIVSCLFLFGIFYCIIVNFRTAMKDMESTVTISVFFDEDISDENIRMIGEQIRLRPEVNTMDFISADQAWEEYARTHYEDDYDTAMAAFAGDNPLKNSASYKISLKTLDNQSEFVQYLKSLPGVRKTLSSEVTADGISALNSIVTYASIGIVLILLLVSIFLISNTITIGITVRKEEIGIMKLIGATNFFVRAPFIVEGIVIGLVGSMIPLILVYYMYDTVIQYVIGRFKVMQKLFAFVPANEIFAVLIPVSAAIGIGLGLIGSILTTRKHLKV